MKKTFTVLTSALLAFSVIAGCTEKQDKENDAKGAGSKKDAEAKIIDDGSEKMTITLMNNSNKGGGWPEDHPIVQELNKRLNIDLKIQWIPSETYQEKLNVLAASNKFPDFFKVGEPSLYLKWQEKGVFMDIAPYVNQFPNFKKQLDDEYMKLMNPKGKMYGLPVYAPEFRENLAIRQDWLEKLNLKAPTTIDEFYQTAKAFVEKDPDGNGRNDTIGFSFLVNNNGGFTGIEHIMGAFGLGNEWKLENGKLIPYQTQTKELKDFIGFLRKAYAEGVLDKDFAVNKSRDHVNKFEAGKLGINPLNPNNLYKTIPDLKKLQPSTKVVQLLPPKGPNGLQAVSTTGGLEKIVINAKIEPKKQQRILKLLDYILSDEGYDLTKNGIEGRHYKKEGDKYVMLDAYLKDRAELLETWFFRRFDPLIQVRKWDDKEYEKQILSWFDNAKPYRWPNPALGLESATEIKSGVSLQQKWTEKMVKVIVGQEPLESIDKIVAGWKSGGGDQITKEINEAYQKMK